MTVVRISNKGISYLSKVLCERPNVVTRALFWKVPHASEREDVCLKIGRYRREGFRDDEPENSNPKSELTLRHDEVQALIQFLGENYEPFKAGVRQYVAVDDSFTAQNVVQVKALFRKPNSKELVAFLVKNDVVPEDLLRGIEHQKRVGAITVYQSMLNEERPESDWQRWFKENPWVLGSEFVRILDERVIDPDNIADYLVEAYDGFLDIIEIKRPARLLPFWSAHQDHGNYVPSLSLIRAVTQASSYVFEVEREINSQKFLERMGGVPTVKPRCVVVFGRSHDWNAEQRRAFRILNANYHNLSLMTYDHVLARAKQLLGIKENTGDNSTDYDDEIPF